MMRGAALSLVAAVLAVAALPACRRAVSDEEQVRSLLGAAAKAAEEKRVNDVMTAVSERFEGQGGIDRRGAKQLVAYHALRGAWTALTISGERIDVAGDAADAVVDLVMVRGGSGRTLPELLPEQASVYRFTMKLSREDDGWRVRSAAWRPISLEDAAAGPRSRER